MRRLVRSGAVLLAVVLAAGSSRAQSVSGTGQQASGLFPLAAGLAVFELEHQGSGAFTVRLLDREGGVVEGLAEAQGPFRGSKAVRVPRAGEYLFDVRADGAWSIRLREGGSAPSGASPAAPAEAQATQEGAYAAKQKGAPAWFGAGLAGGLVLGPLGAGGVLAAAASRNPGLPVEVEASLAGRDGAYRQAFTDAYRARQRRDRRVAALVGGATGTLVWAFVIIQIAGWNDTNGEPGKDPGGQLP